MKKHIIDKTFLTITLCLTIAGFLVFTSASLGLLARAQKELIASVAGKQLLLGLGAGGLLCFLLTKVKYTYLKRYAFYILLGALIATFAVFIPGLGMEHNGARRWINLGLVTFQPSELLKYGYVIYLAAWFSHKRKEISNSKYGLIPFIVVTGISGIALMLQPDTDTFLVTATAGFAMFFVAGAKWKDIGILFLLGVVAMGLIIMKNDYIQQRIKTFINPNDNTQSSSYQIRQSLIAIGSGEFSGRGFGQSIQKFNYLPEPVGDSIFAVAAEEFGFIGASFLVLLFIGFALRGLRISSHSGEIFGGLLALGIVILISVQAFMNIAAMLSIIPLSGQTLPFVSHGGTALMLTLGAMGIVFNISKFQKDSI